jgi:nucleotidyltransferase substrate binding protein (TIGR01987 family)
MENQDIRWKQRFQNFSRAFVLLREAYEMDYIQMDMMHKEAYVQRFEFTFELAWKTLKDVMEFDGIVFEKISPRFIIRDAFQYKYIDNPEIWMKMVDDRNLMSHTYNFSTFENVLAEVRSKYFNELEKFYTSLLERLI